MKNPPFDSVVWGSLRLAPIRPLHFLAATSAPGNDTTTLSHHPYILCHFANACTNMIFVVGWVVVGV